MKFTDVKKKKISFLGYYWKNTALFQGFLILGILFILSLNKIDPDSMNWITPYIIGFIVLLNIAVVVGNWLKWRKL